jgi:hypothetical protein
MPTVTPIPDGAHLNLHPATPSRSIGKRPAPKAADLAPWTFQYASSPDGKDINLLIMFHGLGMSLQALHFRASISDGSHVAVTWNAEKKPAQPQTALPLAMEMRSKADALG